MIVGSTNGQPDSVAPFGIRAQIWLLRLELVFGSFNPYLSSDSAHHFFILPLLHFTHTSLTAPSTYPPRSSIHDLRLLHTLLHLSLLALPPGYITPSSFVHFPPLHAATSLCLLHSTLLPLLHIPPPFPFHLHVRHLLASPSTILPPSSLHLCCIGINTLVTEGLGLPTYF